MMSSPIRELLADAQAAEVKGDRPEAARLLRKAAALYRDANNHTRALKMLRHARRLEGVDEDQPGDELLEAPGSRPDPEPSPPPRRKPRRELEDRVAALAPPTLDAWCSFCCRPKTEVGTLVAGPAGAYICQNCVGLCEGLLTGAPPPPLAPSPFRGPRSTPGFIELTASVRARKRLESNTGRVTLVVGPEGSGKSALLEALSDDLGLERVDLTGAVTPQREGELLTMLERGARLAIAVRAEPPKPALVLTGAEGEEPLYDTHGLSAALGHLLPHAILSSVDGVVVLPAMDADALEALAVGLVATRGDLELSPAMVKQIAALAVKSGRGAHELVALVARVPKGQWK